MCDENLQNRRDILQDLDFFSSGDKFASEYFLALVLTLGVKLIWGLVLGFFLGLIEF